MAKVGTISHDEYLVRINRLEGTNVFAHPLQERQEDRFEKQAISAGDPFALLQQQAQYLVRLLIPHLLFGHQCRTPERHHGSLALFPVFLEDIPKQKNAHLAVERTEYCNTRSWPAPLAQTQARARDKGCRAIAHLSHVEVRNGPKCVFLPMFIVFGLCLFRDDTNRHPFLGGRRY